MPQRASTLLRGDRVLLGLALLHGLLGLWALWAWIHGPFAGEGVLDGAELLALARTGGSGTFETKSPLYPALLSVAFALLGDSPWTVGVLGLALSQATLWACARLARRAGGDLRASRLAAGLYVLSGSALAFGVQPLPTMLATALFAWGALALAGALQSRADGLAVLAGILLASSALTRAPLLPATLALVTWAAWRGRRRTTLCVLGSLFVVALLAVAVWGARAWPSGAMFNLRLGNGAERSGICDVRPGPQYDRPRLEAAFAPPSERGTAPAFERFHRTALRREVAEEPLGALATLARKAYLFCFRTETVSSADFRHGLARFPLSNAMWLSLGIIAPIGLWGLARSRRAILVLPVLALLAVNVLWMTCARYRFPALPFLCASAGILIASRPARGTWLGIFGLALALNVNLSGRLLTVPGDGLVQEARLYLARDRRDARVQQTFAAAFAAGSRDARAHYELALALEADGPLQDLAASERHYRLALELEPAYPEAAENLMAHLMRRGLTSQAEAFARGPGSTVPYAARLSLNLASLVLERDPSADVSALMGAGLRDLALRTLAGGDLDQAHRWAIQARQAGSDDPRLDLLVGP